MKAMIFAAGLGTRLKPLTNYRPKALVEVNGIALLEIAIRRLVFHGFDDIIINVHHFSDQIINFLKKKENFGVKITISDEGDQLLDTGGGLSKAADFFDDGQPFLVYNADIVSDIDLKAFYNAHLENDGIVTLAVRKRETSRYLIFNEDQLMQGWMNINTGDIIMCRQDSRNMSMLAFSGIHVISPAIFDLIDEKRTIFSIIDVYLKLATSHKIYGFLHSNSFWVDVGKKPNIAIAEKLLPQLKLAKID